MARIWPTFNHGCPQVRLKRDAMWKMVKVSGDEAFILYQTGLEIIIVWAS